jgi:NTE family protein
MKIMQTNGKKVGLALSGGAARGLAHVGVLRILEKEGIPIHMITGTSAGAVAGAAYAWSHDTSHITRAVLDSRWRRTSSILDLSFPRNGLIKGKKIRDFFISFFGGNIKFKDLRIPYACVATDIDTGEEVVISRGSVADALRASISVPGIFNAVKFEGHYLVDGGLTTPVPVQVVRKLGADFVIAVNVNPAVTERMSPASKQRAAASKPPNIFQVMLQSIYITSHSLAQGALAAADVIIEPDVGDIGAGDFRKVRELIRRGRLAAQAAIPEIRRKLGEL